MEKVLNKINLIGGMLVTFLSSLFGSHWYLFAAFLILNVIDYITGIIKAKYTHTENSNKGWRGIAKKTGYWLIIAISFFIAQFFGELGTLIELDLGFTVILGWLTLATFIINEIRSVIENLIIIGVEVPKWLITGLEVASDKLMNEGDDFDNHRN